MVNILGVLGSGITLVEKRPGLITKLRLFTPIMALSLMAKEMKLSFCIASSLHLDEIRTVGDGPMPVSSLTTLPWTDGTPSIIGTPILLGRMTNDKGFYAVTTNSFGYKCGTLYVVGNKSPSFGPFGTRRWR